MRTWKAPDFQRPGDRGQDRFDLFGEDRAQPALVEPLELLPGDRLADSVRRLGAEVRGDQRLLDVVERRGVERRAAGDPGEVVGDPLGSLGKAAAQAIEPAHLKDAYQMIARASGDSGEAGLAALGAVDATGAKPSLWPLPSLSISTG